jgi:hypothetical protein
MLGDILQAANRLLEALRIEALYSHSDVSAAPDEKLLAWKRDRQAVDRLAEEYLEFFERSDSRRSW